jgi:hypothetical protein
MEYLDRVADHRSRRGRRYELGFLLAVVVAATACAGHDEVAGYAQWAADAPVWALTALGAKSDPLTGRVPAPSESTLRALREVDAGDLQRLTARWVAAIMAGKVAQDGKRLPAVAIDGKSVRGAAAGGSARPHLLGAATHDGAIMVAPHQIHRQEQRDHRTRHPGGRIGPDRGVLSPSMPCTPSTKPPNTSSVPQARATS